MSVRPQPIKNKIAACESALRPNVRENSSVFIPADRKFDDVPTPQSNGVGDVKPTIYTSTSGNPAW